MISCNCLGRLSLFIFAEQRESLRKETGFLVPLYPIFCRPYTRGADRQPCADMVSARLTVFVVLLSALAACIGLFKPTDRSLRVKRLLSQQLRVPLAALRSKEISAIDVDRTR
jgi:hypothetical protein